MLRGVHLNVEMSINVYLFSCEVSKDGSVDYQIKDVLWESFKNEPFDAVVEWTWPGNFLKIQKSGIWLRSTPIYS